MLLNFTTITPEKNREDTLLIEYMTSKALFEGKNEKGRLDVMQEMAWMLSTESVVIGDAVNGNYS